MGSKHSSAPSMLHTSIEALKTIAAKSLCQRFNFDSTDDSKKEPVYLLCDEAQARIADLTASSVTYDVIEQLL